MKLLRSRKKVTHMKFSQHRIEQRRTRVFYVSSIGQLCSSNPNSAIKLRASLVPVTRTLAAGYTTLFGMQKRARDGGSRRY